MYVVHRHRQCQDLLDAQNLLRTLTESNAKPLTDLRLLLNTVKEGRVRLLLLHSWPWLTSILQKQSAETKLSDAFYDALEGLLADLKSLPLVCGSVTVYDENLLTVSFNRITAMRKRSSSPCQRRKSQIIMMVRSTVKCDVLKLE